MQTVLRLVQRVEQLVKHHCRAPRPIDLSDAVYPVIQTPDHSSYPSGHATESFALATVLHLLMSAQPRAGGLRAQVAPGFRGLDFVAPAGGAAEAIGKEMTDQIAGFPGFPLPYRVAARIAINRTVAGVHFPVDSFAGAYLGCLLAQALHGLAQGRRLVPQHLDAPSMDAADDFTLRALSQALDGVAGAGGEELAPPACFARLWGLAQAEWRCEGTRA